MFIREFTDFVTDILTEYRNIIITGDINIAINKDDNNAQAYISMLEAMGLV